MKISDYKTQTGYTNALWNGMIYNAILFYAKSGYTDTKKLPTLFSLSMEAISRIIVTWSITLMM